MDANKHLSASEAMCMGSEVIRISSCFDIDSRILLGLIKLEFEYNQDAVSFSGASGLTQFTTIGIQEVNDQLGIRGAGQCTK